MQRKLNDWLTSYIKYTNNSESPISYHTWAGVSCIAAALQRKVYMQMGHTALYPNNYIILVGPSANARKGEPLTIARDLISNLNIRTFGENPTPEALIRSVKGAELAFQDTSTGDWKWHSSVTGFIEELSVFTGVQNTTFLAYLTNWWDSRDYWKRETKHQGVDEIHGMCFNLLAATAPDWLPHILPTAAVGGGFTSRCIFVVEERKRKTIADPNLNLPPKELKKELIHDLEIIQTLNGRYEWSEAAKAAYEEWYEGEDRKLMSGTPFMGDPTLDGYAGRRAAHIRKISMVMAASHSDELVIAEGDFNRALALLSSAEKKMNKVFAGVGRGRYVAETDMVISYIQRNKEVAKSQLIRDLGRNLDKLSLTSIMDVLRESRLIEERIDTEDRETYIIYRG